MKPELRFEKMKIRAAGLGQESCVPDFLGEHILQNDLQFELDEQDEIYEGYGRIKNAYPYRQYDGYDRVLKEMEIETAVLENDHLRAVFLTGYGGRLWELVDKDCGKNMLYTNNVLRFSNLAVRNAWFSGGVEWNIGVIGHTPYTTCPMYTARTNLDDGTPVLRMYEYERIRRVPYQMDFWLQENERYLNCRMRIVNESDKVVPMYWWSNMAVPEFENGRIAVPADAAFTATDGIVHKVKIPVVNEVDVTDYKSIPRSVDYFFDIPDEEIKYIANFDGTGDGILQISTGRLRSRKLFSWGSNQASDRWQEFLTDGGGRYLEIQSGLGKTQYGCIPMAPHTAWEWLEKYGPIRISEAEAQGSFDERRKAVRDYINEKQFTKEMEGLLKKTSGMAKKEALLIRKGSGYGALTVHGKGACHLRFEAEQPSLGLWKQFFETGVLHNPDPKEAPDEFLIDEENLDFIKKTLKDQNKENWYAFYHAGTGCFITGAYAEAENFWKKSAKLRENAWAYHGLASLCLLTGRKEEGAAWMLRGIEMQKEKVSYLKEGFRILFSCGAYQKICDIYESLDGGQQQVGKLKFYWISALYKLGENEKAFARLEENGGLKVDDIREGEDSVAELWQKLYMAIYGEEAAVPYRYDFKAS